MNTIHPQTYFQFQSYLDHDYLLIQFLTCEFITSHQILQIIFEFTEGLIHMEGSFQFPWNELNEKLTLLLGKATPQHAKGPLTKLKDYCDQYHFHQHSERVFTSFYNSTTRVWLTTTHLLSLMQYKEKEGKNHLTDLYQSILKIKQSMESMTKQLPKMFSIFKENENVIFFLLQKKEVLQQIYLDLPLEKNFKILGKKNILDLLRDRYRSRGFDPSCCQINRHLQ